MTLGLKWNATFILPDKSQACDRPLRQNLHLCFFFKKKKIHCLTHHHILKSCDSDMDEFALLVHHTLVALCLMLSGDLCVWLA